MTRNPLKIEMIRKTVVFEQIVVKSATIRILRFGPADKAHRVHFTLATGIIWSFWATVRNVIGVGINRDGPHLKIRTSRRLMSKFSISRQTEHTS